MMTFALALATYLAFNVLVFLIYGWDKKAAQTGKWRVRENTLLWLALLGGSLGALVAQRSLRHKTHKEPFRTYLMGIIVLHIALGASLIIIPDWPEAALSAMLQNPNP